MKVIYSVIIVLSLLIGCSQKKAVNNVKSDSNLSAENVSNDHASDGENFYDFLNQFNTDRIFQLARIEFPVKASISGTELDGMPPREESIAKQEWEHLDLTYDSTYVIRDYDQYHQDVFFGNNPDSATVELRGINNGIYANYYFKRKDGKWYLVRLEEASF